MLPRSSMAVDTRHYLCALNVCLSVAFYLGCEGRNTDSDVVLPPVAEAVQPASELTTADPGLSAEVIERTIDGIHTAGGAVMRDAAGRITGVDVARDGNPIGRATAEAVLRLPRLEVLRLAANAISPELLSQLASQEHLTELLLRDARLNDEQFVHLMENVRHLKRLTLRRVSGLTDSGLGAVASLPELEVLALIEMRMSGSGLALVGKIGRLRSLDLRSCEGLVADDYRTLPALEQLAELKIGGSAVDDSVLESVTALRSLQSLLVEDAAVSADAVKRLAENRAFVGRIRSLAFTRCYGVTDDVLSLAIVLPRLETLSVRECPVSGGFLTSIAETPPHMLPKLQSLVVTRAFLSESAIGALPVFADSLRRLNLSGVMLTPQAMQSIGKLRELRSLSLAGCSLGNEAVEPLATLKKLNTLDLSGNLDITDQGVRTLDALLELEQLDTRDTGVTAPNEWHKPGNVNRTDG